MSVRPTSISGQTRKVLDQRIAARYARSGLANGEWSLSNKDSGRLVPTNPVLTKASGCSVLLAALTCLDLNLDTPSLAGCTQAP